MDKDIAHQPLSFERSNVCEAPEIFNNLIDEAWEKSKTAVKLSHAESTVGAVLKLTKSLELPLLHPTCSGAEIKFALDTAVRPLPNSYSRSYGSEVSCAAICLYPAHLEECLRYKDLRHRNTMVKVSCVAAGFPDGQVRREVAWKVAERISAMDANEIDVACSRGSVAEKDWEGMYIQLIEFKALLSPEIKMKAILATQDAESLCDMYTSTMMAMISGSDFICLWSGNHSTNIDYCRLYAACIAITEFNRLTGRKVGLKLYGDIAFEEALVYMQFVNEILGDEWNSANYLRISSCDLQAAVCKNLCELEQQHQSQSLSETTHEGPADASKEE
uniref:deoxyribose-phosphate aldolase n=1 Tax=Trichuris muris TaxID=70415 RepID=A0A5S6QJ39_TRIMR